MSDVPALRRCKCGEYAEMWYMPLTGAYNVRCRNCQNKGRPHLSEKMAAEAWNDKEWKGDLK